jgi:hypothetical protein
MGLESNSAAKQKLLSVSLVKEHDLSEEALKCKFRKNSNRIVV